MLSLKWLKTKSFKNGKKNTNKRNELATTLVSCYYTIIYTHNKHKFLNELCQCITDVVGTQLKHFVL